MGTMRLHAIGIDEVRELFTGSPPAAEHLRALAAAAFPPPPADPPPRGLLAKLGPLLRKPPGAPVVRDGVPTGTELEAVVHGRHVPPHRLEAAWALVDLWLHDRAWRSLSVSIDEAASDGLDFELASAGVSPHASLKALFGRSLGIPLTMPPGQASGYLRGNRADAFRSAWAGAVPQLSAHNAETAQQVSTWLDGLAQWQEAARAAGRPQPDIVARYSR